MRLAPACLHMMRKQTNTILPVASTGTCGAQRLPATSRWV